MKLDLNIYWNNPEKHYRLTFSWRIWIPTDAHRGCCLISYLILIDYLINSSKLWFTLQIAILLYLGAAFGPRAPPLFSFQTRKLFATNQELSHWLYTKNLMDMFLNQVIFKFLKLLNFSALQGFSADNLASRNAILFIFSSPERPWILWRVHQIYCLVTVI